LPQSGNALSQAVLNKSIAIVGNASSLLTQDKGEEIDSHDVVVRINANLPKMYERDMSRCLGEKTDIWVSNRKDMVNEYFTQGNYIELVVLFKKETPKYPKYTTGFKTIQYFKDLKYKNLDLYGFDWKESSTVYHNSEEFKSKFTKKLTAACTPERDAKIHNYPWEKSEILALVKERDNIILHSLPQNSS
jgi:hypothetical protein